MIEWPDSFFKSLEITDGGLLKAGASKVTFSGYKLQGRTRRNGMSISIENKKGSYRSGTDGNGKKWRTLMRNDYGYIRNSLGADKDHLDVFLGPNENPSSVYVVKQIKPDTGKFDEDKVMLGFDSMREAKAAYLSNYDSSKYFGRIKKFDVEDFKNRALNKKEVDL